MCCAPLPSSLPAAMRSDFPTMASMVEVLATIRLPQLLGPATLAQLQGAAADLRSTLGSDQVWRQCIMADQPCLILRALLFESSARHALMHCYGHLCRSTIGIGDEPLLQNAEEARRLGKLLHRMEKARGAHLKEGGRVAGFSWVACDCHHAKTLMVIKATKLLDQDMSSGCHQSSMSILEDVVNSWFVLVQVKTYEFVSPRPQFRKEAICIKIWCWMCAQQALDLFLTTGHAQSTLTDIAAMQTLACIHSLMTAWLVAKIPLPTFFARFSSGMAGHRSGKPTWD